MVHSPIIYTGLIVVLLVACNSGWEAVQAETLQHVVDEIGVSEEIVTAILSPVLPVCVDLFPTHFILHNHPRHALLYAAFLILISRFVFDMEMELITLRRVCNVGDQLHRQCVSSDWLCGLRFGQGHSTVRCSN